MATTANDSDVKKKKEDDSKTEELDGTMTPENIIKYLMTKSESNDVLIKVLGSPQKQKWKAKECGDGNINYIFIVEGCNGSVVVKQAPPFIRLVGPDWALKPNRLNYEVSYTQKVLQYSPENAPKIYLVDNDAFLFVMEDLNISKMVVFRSQIAKGIGCKEYPNVGQHVGLMLANMLFKTSDFSLKAEDKWKELQSFCMNNEMVSLTEQVIFEEPFFEAKLNRFSMNNEEYKKLCPQMIESVKKMRSDDKIIRTVYDLRRKFRNLHQTLCHGDLHTGSIMVNKERTVAIDAEFSFYGPFFVDVGLFIGNVMLACFSQPLYAKENENYREYVEYLGMQCKVFWTTFSVQFLELWNTEKNEANMLPQSIGSDEMRKQYKLDFMNDVWTDSIKFAAIILIRRTLGIADGPEFRIDESRNAERWKQEEKAMRFGMDMLNGKVSTQNIEVVIDKLFLAVSE